jgi:hypothetical protein
LGQTIDMMDRFLCVTPVAFQRVGRHRRTACAIRFDAYSEALATERAFSVGVVLTKYGVPRSRIETRGIGRADYIADNRKEHTPRLNRRVEVRWSWRPFATIDGGSMRHRVWFKLDMCGWRQISAL